LAGLVAAGGPSRSYEPGEVDGPLLKLFPSAPCPGSARRSGNYTSRAPTVNPQNSSRPLRADLLSDDLSRRPSKLDTCGEGSVRKEPRAGDKPNWIPLPMDPKRLLSGRQIREAPLDLGDDLQGAIEMLALMGRHQAGSEERAARRDGGVERDVGVDAGIE
jgi:hypothetical protein